MLLSLFNSSGIFKVPIGMLLLGIFLSLMMAGPVRANNDVVFTFPEKSLMVFEVDTSQTFKGYIKRSVNELEIVEISFDGQIWREVDKISGENPGYYYWQYTWTVAGKGRSFVLIRARTDEDKLVEGRILIEVYVPPEKEVKQNTYELLTKIREENRTSSTQDDELNSNINGLGYLGVFDYVIEKNLGQFVSNKWTVFLPTKDQQQFILESLWQINVFIRKYPAGIDLLFLITLPYILVLSVAVVLVLLYYFNDIYEKIRYFGYYFQRKKENKSGNKLKGYLLDIKSRQLVPFALIQITGRDGNKHNIISNINGSFEASGLNSDEYTYEVFKHGYKQYIIDDFDTMTFRNHPVVSANFKLEGAKENVLVLAAESFVSKKRAVKSLRSDFYYILVKWFWQNINPIFTIGMIFGLVWLFFTDYTLINYYLWLLLIGYVVYRYVIRINEPWGRIYDQNGRLYDNIQINLIREDAVYATTWTDWKGRFSFGKIDSGMYSITIADHNFRTTSSNKQTYHGQKFYIDGDNIDDYLPLNIIV